NIWQTPISLPPDSKPSHYSGWGDVGSKAHDIVEASGRSYSTVTTHKYNGLGKLGLRDGNDLLPFIYENGLLHELDS
ncbi:hypothetical protein VDR74_21250, partial [Xanthomonas campestris pv. campestris]|nr:hypothetical protein [Xanthomonas campestris pv. campestris]MEB2027368.1 hypothetical protein [Xanthomonas campestris pv. campestris]